MKKSQQWIISKFQTKSFLDVSGYNSIDFGVFIPIQSKEYQV